VDLGQDSEFGEPISVNGVGHRFSVFAGNRSDHSIVGEGICDAKDKLFVTV